MGVKVLFIHHSTGANLLKEGKLRTILEKIAPKIEFWDHSYNLYPLFPKILGNVTYHSGLADGKGRLTGKDFDIVLSNNSPKEYVEIFSRDPNDKTLNSILSFDVIAFKNCYPTTKITSDAQLEHFKKYYQTIKKGLSRFLTKKFIVLTPPPLRKELTKPEYAKRADQLAQWLVSKDFLENSKNIFVFDFFHLLADKQGMLKKEYTRFFPFDSHPNKKANVEVALQFAQYLKDHYA